MGPSLSPRRHSAAAATLGLHHHERVHPVAASARHQLPHTLLHAHQLPGARASFPHLPARHGHALHAGKDSCISFSFAQFVVLNRIVVSLGANNSTLQASSSLPKTSYFKMVDVWLLSSIFFIFLIFVLHTLIVGVREWEPAAQLNASSAPPMKLAETTPASSEKSSSSNTVHPTTETGEATGDHFIHYFCRILNF